MENWPGVSWRTGGRINTCQIQLNKAELLKHAQQCAAVGVHIERALQPSMPRQCGEIATASEKGQKVIISTVVTSYILLMFNNYGTIISSTCPVIFFTLKMRSYWGRVLSSGRIALLLLW